MTELRLQANDDNLSAVNAFVEEQLEANECPMKASMQMMIALEELFVNVAHYAYGGAEGMVTVQVEKQEDMLLVRKLTLYIIPRPGKGKAFFFEPFDLFNVLRPGVDNCKIHLMRLAPAVSLSRVGNERHGENRGVLHLIA